MEEPEEQRRDSWATVDEHEDDEDEDEKEEDDDDPQLELSVFKWFDHRHDSPHGLERKPRETATAKHIASTYGVPRHLIIQHLDDEIEESDACKGLPFTLLLVVAYSAMVILHMDAPVLRAVEESVTADITDNANFAWDSHYIGHKDVNDVNSIADFWSFLNKGIFPLAFTRERVWSEELLTLNFTSKEPVIHPKPFDSREWGMITRYNRIVGGIRMRQERSTHLEECEIAPELGDFSAAPCLGAAHGYALDPELDTARITVADESMTEWFWTHEDLEQTTKKLRTLEAARWLSVETSKVEIGVPVFNAEYGVHTLITVNLFFSPGGHIWKHIIPQSCYANWYFNPMTYMWDGIFFLSILWIVVNEVKELCGIVKHHGCFAIFSKYLSFFNVLDWVSVITGTAIMVMWIINLMSTEELNAAAKQVGELRPVGADVQDLPEARAYMDLLETTVNNVTIIQRAMAVYPLVVVFRLLKAFHAQPRMALVTLTLQESFTDLGHFMVVFLCMFASFTISGMVLFGREVEELANPFRGILFCFRLLIGDFDYKALALAGRYLAGVWVSIFLTLMSLLMMNILMAIVMDSYTNVKERTGNAETLVEETKQLISRTYEHYRGRYVPLEYVLKGVKGDFKQRPVRRSKSRENVDSGEEEDDADEDDAWDATPVSPKRRVKRNSGVYGSEKENSNASGGRLTRWIKSFSRKNSDLDPSLIEEFMHQNLKQTDLINIIASMPTKKKSRKAVYTLSEAQATTILVSTINDYYEINKRSYEVRESLYLARKIYSRALKVIKLLWEPSKEGDRADAAAEAGDHDYFITRDSDGMFSVAPRVAAPEEEPGRDEDPPPNPNRAMREAREEVMKFVEDVQADRKEAAAQLTRLRAEVAALQKLLKEKGSAPPPLPSPLGRRQNGAGGTGAPSRLEPLDEEPPSADANSEAGDPGAAAELASNALAARRAGGALAQAADDRQARSGGGPQGSSYVAMMQDLGLLPMDYQEPLRDLNDEPLSPLPSSCGSQLYDGHSFRSGSFDASDIDFSDLVPEEEPSQVDPFEFDDEPRELTSRVNPARLTSGVGLAGPPATSDAGPASAAPGEFNSFQDAQRRVREALRERQPPVSARPGGVVMTV
eukprot:TRINITY_DN30195_c0_g1_i1.p1 TRINITY_DN30195_c0_g1~~TRINITY_DN30195_c0_g1_i1.p1  ORF type:complete len:1121 (+),score=241.06 TRINITY_DN30195_c0_g1_i1:31-3393(+)